MFYSIKTRIKNKEIKTLFDIRTHKWVTICKINNDGKITTSSSDSDNEYEAGLNHLKICFINNGL